MALTIDQAISKYAAAGQSLTRGEAREVEQLAEVLKHYFVAGGKDFVVGAQGQPLLYSYSSDGTQQKTRSTKGFQVSPTKRVKRKASCATAGSMAAQPPGPS
eukprot:20191-Lingulodinium_polyedra.AAC.1